MRLIKTIPAIAFMAFLMSAAQAFCKADTVELYADALTRGDIPELEKILAPNFIFIGSNGHIRDKEHFIQELKARELVVERLNLTNQRDTDVGETRIVTANGFFAGKSAMPLPKGQMRYTVVVANNKGKEEVVLFQATPVIPTADCKDGNCRIR